MRGHDLTTTSIAAKLCQREPTNSAAAWLLLPHCVLTVNTRDCPFVMCPASQIISEIYYRLQTCKNKNSLTKTELCLRPQLGGIAHLDENKTCHCLVRKIKKSSLTKSHVRRHPGSQRMQARGDQLGHRCCLKSVSYETVRLTFEM